MRVFIFPSTRAVIKAEGAARQGGLRFRVIPVPRSISPHCGMALEIDDDEAPIRESRLAPKAIPFVSHGRQDLSL